jgi:hypothetical protein
MQPSPSPWQHLWPRLLCVIFASGIAFLGLQLADLGSLRAFAAMGPAANPAGTAAVRPVAYVPVAPDATGGSLGATVAGAPVEVAEVGDGGDLGRRARGALDTYRPFVLAEVRDDLAYIALAPILRLLGGELRWAPGDVRAAIILPAALITFVPGQVSAYRNYRQVALDGPPLADAGDLRLPVKTLGPLCGLEVEILDTAHQALYRVAGPDQTAHVVVRERMYSLEVSRSERWLQVYLLSLPVKRYPLCVGEGNNTPVGDFHIANKAVWPPWEAYWGEHMPGGSARNPLGARWLGTSAHGRETGRVIGIHGTNQPSSIGQRISGGCLRCYNRDAIELYNNIPVGTPLTIHE